MNNKGMAITTMIYAAVILFAIVILTTLAVTSASYTNKHDLIDRIDSNLTECLGRGDC